MSCNVIIVGLDDSPSSRAALRWAAQNALRGGTPLRAIHVLDLPNGMSSVGWVNIPRLTQDEIESAYCTKSPKCSNRSTRCQITRSFHRRNGNSSRPHRAWCDDG
jgi:hypothetical protein